MGGPVGRGGGMHQGFTATGRPGAESWMDGEGVE